MSPGKQNEMQNDINALNKIFQKSNELNRTNKLLRSKYENDEKYLRLHKRLMEKNLLSNDEQKLYRISVASKEILIIIYTK